MTQDPKSIQEKIREAHEILQKQETSGPPPGASLWWLSYADEKGFRGVVITRAGGFLLATAQANLLGVSPGGQVQGFELPPEAEEEIKITDLDRLLSEEELKEYRA